MSSAYWCETRAEEDLELLENLWRLKKSTRRPAAAGKKAINPDPIAI